MSRVATISTVFEANLAPAKAAYERFVSEVEGRPLKIPLSSGGGTSGTLGGLSVSSSPSAFPVGAASQNPTFFGAQIAQQIGQAVAQAIQQSGAANPGASPVSPPGSGNPASFSSRALSRFRRGAGLYFAAREVNALANEYEEERELNEVAARDPRAATSQILSEAESDRRAFFPSLLRTGFSKAANGISSAFGGGPVAISDTDKYYQARADTALDAAGDAQQRLSRAGKTLDVDSIERSRLEAKFRFNDSVREGGNLRNEANTIAGSSPAESQRLKQAAQLFEESALSFYDTEKKRFDRLANSRISGVGAQSEITGERLRNNTDRAERLELVERQRRELEEANLSNDPKYIAGIKQQQKDELDLLNLHQAHRIELTGLGLTGQGDRLAKLLGHDPIGADVSGIVTSGLEESLQLRNVGLGQFRKQSLENSRAQLQLTQQNFLEGFHATQIGQNFETGSARQTQDVSTILNDIKNGMDTLTQAIKDVAAGK